MNQSLLRSVPTDVTKRFIGIAALWVSSVLVTSALAPGRAVAAGARVAVMIEGAGAETLGPDVVAALPPGIEVLDPSALGEELARRGLDHLKATIELIGRRAVIKRLHRVERAIGADAIILGSVEPGGRRGPGDLHLVVVLVSKSEAALDETLGLNKKGRVRAGRLKSLLGPVLEQLAGKDETAASEGSEKEAQSPPDHEAKSTAASGEAASGEENDDGSEESGAVTPAEALLLVFGGLDLGGRQFHYNQRITNDNLRPYDLPSGPLLPITPGGVLALELYPLARTSLVGGRDVGVVAHLGYNFVKAQLGSTILETKWYSWDASVRGRIHLGPRGASPTLGVEAGLGDLVFSFSDGAGLSDAVPAVDYRYLRAGADGRFPIGRFALLVGAAYRRLLSTSGTAGASIPAAGRLGEHFPRAAIAGMDAQLGAALALTANLEARLGVSYVRYWAAFNSRPGDKYIAGGAVDQMLHADLGIAAFF